MKAEEREFLSFLTNFTFNDSVNMSKKIFVTVSSSLHRETCLWMEWNLHRETLKVDLYQERELEGPCFPLNPLVSDISQRILSKMLFGTIFGFFVFLIYSLEIMQKLSPLGCSETKVVSNITRKQMRECLPFKIDIKQGN